MPKVTDSSPGGALLTHQELQEILAYPFPTDVTAGMVNDLLIVRTIYIRLIKKIALDMWYIATAYVQF